MKYILLISLIMANSQIAVAQKERRILQKSDTIFAEDPVYFKSVNDINVYHYTDSITEPLAAEEAQEIINESLRATSENYMVDSAFVLLSLDEMGHVYSYKVLKTFGSLSDKSIGEIVDKLPAFKPAKMNNTVVKYTMYYIIKYK